MEASIRFRSGGEFPDIAELVPRALPWILAAGQPYFDWLCGARDAAERTVAMWMRQPASELFIRKMQFLQCGSVIAGGILSLPGAELKVARTADIHSYWETLEPTSRKMLIDRLSRIQGTFAPVAEDEYYASKMALAHSFLGKGLSKVLLERCLEQGRALGFTKFRADVQTENRPSLRCFLARGFEIFYTGQSADGALRYHALRLQQRAR
jgi:GNAT superfamily N-acetyltransferase